MVDGKLTSNTHAVLKLQLGDDGGTRRVAFSRLWNNTSSNVSYGKLVSLAIEYSFPQDAPYDVKNYDVVVTYLDEDGDKITISSCDELAEAFLQFVGKTPPVLRANATVIRAVETTTETPEPTTPVVPPPSATTAPAAPDASPSTPSRQSSSHQNSFGQQPGQQPPAPQLNVILESIVSILASAVVALQNHVNRGPDGSAPSTPTNRHISSDEAANLTATATPRAAALAQSHSSAEGEEAERFVKEVIEKISLGGGQDVETDEEVEVDDVPKEEANEEEESTAGVRAFAPVPEGFNPHFIHGRHTCDGCLCTPVVGTRYHAKNLPDYDLCQNCITNYKGKDIKFEPVELDRDRPLQHRWQRRQMRRARQAKFGGGGVNYPGGCRGRRRQNTKVDAQLGPDMALKEAIRRSLLEANAKRVPTSEDVPKEEDTKDLPKEKETATAEEEAVPEPDTPEPSAPPKAEVEVEEEEEEEEEEDTPIEEASTPTKKGPAEAPTTPGSAKSTFSADAAGFGDTAEAIGATLDHCAQAIDEIVSEFEKGTTTKDGKQQKTADVFASAVASAVDAANIAASVASEVASASEFEKGTTTKDGTKQKTADVFASAVASAVDAASIAASVASEVAAAFDKQHGDASDSMSAMTSSFPSVAVPKNEDNADEAKDDISVGSEPEIVVKPDDATEKEVEPPVDAPEGATILPSVTTETEDEEKHDEEKDSVAEEEDEWQVVDEDAQRDAQAANDEMLARATEFIGSALFQSDIQSSGVSNEEKSTSSSSSSSGSSSSSSSTSSSSSGVESVPSTVPTISSEPISAVLLTRWEPEIRQLHELGFLDDRQSLDALERLEAANMGVDSTDPVTVNDAVNYLLAHK